MPEGKIIEFKLRNERSDLEPEKLPAKILQFPVKNTQEGQLSFENQSKVESTTLNLGQALVDHPIGALGGFLDTAVDQPDPKLFKKLLEGGAYGLMWQAVPGLALLPDESNVHDEYLVAAYSYLEDAVSDRKKSGSPLFIPTKPSEIASSGAFNFGDIISSIESVHDEKLKSQYIEANAQRTAAGVLGIADGARHPMIEERIEKDRNFITTTLEFRKRFPDSPHPHLKIVK